MTRAQIEAAIMVRERAKELFDKELDRMKENAKNTHRELVTITTTASIVNSTELDVLKGILRVT
jgi:hypothetical protein